MALTLHTAGDIRLGRKTLPAIVLTGTRDAIREAAPLITGPVEVVPAGTSARLADLERQLTARAGG